MTGEGRTPALVFGEAAEDFDRVRPSYPADLFDDVLAYQGEGVRGLRALEVGAGTGKATVALAERGVRLVAVEPDEAMAAVLTRRVAGLPEVQVVTSRFEDYPAGERFGLLLSADAWHWVSPGERWELAGRTLAPGGVLALCWNRDRIDDPVLRQRMLDVLAAEAPAVRVDDTPVTDESLRTGWPGEELAERPEFTDAAGRIYPWRRVVSGADYLAHMATRSQSRMLAAPVRERLFAALATVFDGDVPLAVDTVLYLARRA